MVVRGNLNIYFIQLISVKISVRVKEGKFVMIVGGDFDIYLIQLMSVKIDSIYTL